MESDDADEALRALSDDRARLADRLRAPSWLYLLLAGVLLLLSTAYALASLLSAWWVLAPAAVCLVLLLAGGHRFDHLKLRRGR